MSVPPGKRPESTSFTADERNRGGASAGRELWSGGRGMWGPHSHLPSLSAAEIGELLKTSDCEIGSVTQAGR